MFYTHPYDGKKEPNKPYGNKTNLSVLVQLRHVLAPNLQLHDNMLHKLPSNMPAVSKKEARAKGAKHLLPEDHDWLAQEGVRRKVLEYDEVIGNDDSDSDDSDDGDGVDKVHGQDGHQSDDDASESSESSGGEGE